MNNTVSEIISKLLDLDDITIITHVRPDGDTLGSAFALMHMLQNKGKHVHVVCESEISPRYRFLSDGKSDISDECGNSVVCVDVASPEMAGKKYSEYAKKADIVIDHHATNAGYGKLNLIVPQAAACGEIIYDIVKVCGCLDACIAECLYTAISTDTGCFVFGNTTSNTHFIASELIKANIDLAKLNKLLFRTKSRPGFEIERRAFASIEYFYNDTILCMCIPLKDIKELGITEDDLEGLSSIPAQIEGIKAAATFREIQNGRYKVSVRTNGDIDGGKVCSEFGGGGHKMAAGCTLEGKYDDLKKIMAESLHTDERRNSTN